MIRWTEDPYNDRHAKGALPHFVVQWLSPQGFRRRRSFTTKAKAAAFTPPPDARDVQYVLSATFNLVGDIFRG